MRTDQAEPIYVFLCGDVMTGRGIDQVLPHPGDPVLYERVITAFTIQTENKELTFSDSGGLQQARMNIFGKITSVAGRRTTAPSA